MSQANRTVDASTPRERAFDRLFRDTHPDFKGTLRDGVRSVMSLAKYGGGLVTAQTITDAELSERTGIALPPRASGYDLDRFGRFDVANPAAIVPAGLLAPDGRYACDGCEGLTDRGALVPSLAGYHCPQCAPDVAARLKSSRGAA